MGACGNSEEERNRAKNSMIIREKSTFKESDTMYSNLENEEKNLNIYYIIKAKKPVGAGFMCKIPYPDKYNLIPVLFASNKVLNSEDIKPGKEITLLCDDNSIRILKIDESKKIYSSNENVTIIEINEKDRFPNNNILEIDFDIFKEDELLNKLINSPIYVINYSNILISSHSKGLIKSINNNNFTIEYKGDKIESGPPGAPIINSKNTRIIGFHVEKDRGIFLNKPIEEFNKLYKKKVEIIEEPKECSEKKIILPEKQINNIIINNKNLEEINTDIKPEIQPEIKSELKSELDSELKTGEINLSLEIERNEINQKIYFLGILNELNKSNTKIYMGNEKNKYTNFFVPQQEGIYKIKIELYSPIKDCSYMFSDCKQLVNIDFSSFNSENVTNMIYMFNGCSKLDNIDLSSFNTQNVTNMSFMFKGCSNLTKINLSSLDTKKVKYMIGMFSDCYNLIDIDLSSLDTKNVTYMNYIFCRCSNLININLNSLDTKNVTNMSGMFEGCYKLSNLNISTLDTQNVSYMIGMFSNCSNLSNIDLSSFKTNNLISTSHMFSGCSKLKNVDLSFCDTSKIINMSYMFNNCFDLVNIDLSSLDTKKVNNANYMFFGCNNLKTIKVYKNSFDKKKSKLNSKVKIITN